MSKNAPSDAVILDAIIERDRRGLLTTTRADILDDTEWTPDTIHQSLHRLEAVGAIRVVVDKAGPSRGRRPIFYALTDRAVRLLDSALELFDG